MSAHLTPVLQLLRLLLEDPRVQATDIDWHLLGGLIRRQNLLLRIAACLERRGEPLPASLRSDIDAARQRAERIAALAQRLDDALEHQGVTHAFLKLEQQHPDMGRDLDLLVGANSPAAETAVRQCVTADAHRGIESRFAGTASYAVHSCRTVVDVHHGRLGRLGEHRRLARIILRRAQPARVGEAMCRVPCLEDQLLLQTAQKLYGRPTLRVADAAWAIRTLQSGRLDWKRTFEAADTAGIVPGLLCHLDYMDQIHRHAFGRPLLEPDVPRRAGRRGWGRIDFGEENILFPAARVNARLFAKQVQHGIASGDWEAVGRLCLLPMAVAAAGWRRLARPRAPEVA